MSKHTPGPWNATRKNDATGQEVDPYYIFIEPGVSVVEMCSNEDRCWADARLIAAAPELLDALIRLSNSYAFIKPPGYPKSDAERQAEEAISKAEGGRV